MMQSYHILEDRGQQIYYGQMSRDDTIPLHSRRPRSPDHFRESAQGWYNPVTFSRTEVIESIMDKCLGMIQSLFILKDQGLRVTLGQMSQDDTIPLHSRGPRPPDHFGNIPRDDTIHLHSRGPRPQYHFRASAQGWYNPTATSLLPLSRKVFPNNTKLVLKVFELYSR